MKTELIQTNDGYQINLIGKLDLLKTNYLRNILVTEFRSQNLIFDFSQLNFVGSNGILLFFNVINELFITHNITAQMVGLGSDFKRVILVEKYPHLRFQFMEQTAVIPVQDSN